MKKEMCILIHTTIWQECMCVSWTQIWSKGVSGSELQERFKTLWVPPLFNSNPIFFLRQSMHRAHKTRGGVSLAPPWLPLYMLYRTVRGERARAPFYSPKAQFIRRQGRRSAHSVRLGSSNMGVYVSTVVYHSSMCASVHERAFGETDSSCYVCSKRGRLKGEH